MHALSALRQISSDFALRFLLIFGMFGAKILGQCNRSKFSSAFGHMCTVPPSLTHTPKAFGSTHTHSHTHENYWIIFNARSNRDTAQRLKRSDKRKIANAMLIIYFKINRKCLWDIWRMHVMAIAVFVSHRMAIRLLFLLHIMCNNNSRMTAYDNFSLHLRAIASNWYFGWRQMNEWSTEYINLIGEHASPLQTLFRFRIRLKCIGYSLTNE